MRLLAVLWIQWKQGLLHSCDSAFTRKGRKGFFEKNDSESDLRTLDLSLLKTEARPSHSMASSYTQRVLTSPFPLRKNSLFLNPPLTLFRIG